MNWLRNILKKKPKPPRELVCVSYAEGDRLLRENKGWRIAPEEDRNRVIGWVYLERDAISGESK